MRGTHDSDTNCFSKKKDIFELLFGFIVMKKIYLPYLSFKPDHHQNSTLNFSSQILLASLPIITEVVVTIQIKLQSE